MSNALTGDFDVVVEVGIPTVNRILAAQHQARRYLHSFSVRIDDVAPPRILAETLPRTNTRATDLMESAAATATVRTEAIGRTVRPCLGVILNPEEYTGIRGFADVQASTPTITIPGEIIPIQIATNPSAIQSTSRVTVHVEIRARFTADEGSPPMPEFIHGELQATVDVNQGTSQAGNVIEIDFAAADIEVTFNSFWADPPLSTEQQGRIERLLRNLLRTRFEPTNVLLPQNLSQLRFKTMQGNGGTQAIALLLNLRGNAPANPDPGSVTQIFLRDDFAIAIGRDYLVPTLIQAITKAVDDAGLRDFDIRFSIIFFTIAYHIHLNSFDVELRSGQIVLTLNGRATTGSILPDFDFRVSQPVTLRVANGAIILEAVGDPDLTIFDGIGGFIIGLFRGAIVARLRETRDGILSQVQPSIQQLLDSSANLGSVIAALKISAQLTYTSVEIQPDGLILQGRLSLPAWAPVHVEFSTKTMRDNGTVEIELDALKSWIPGGTVSQYAWMAGRTVVKTEQHRFITKISVEADSSVQWCLRVEGTRISPTGTPVLEQVNRLRCHIIPNIPLDPIRLGSVFGSNRLFERLTVALLRERSEHPELPPEVIAHIALSDSSMAPQGSSANTVVHFADSHSATNLLLLRDALLASNKKDSAVVIVAVLPQGYLERVKPFGISTNASLALTEDYEGSWRRVFGVEKLPATYLINPQGQIVWRDIGQLDVAKLVAAFNEYLFADGVILRQELNLAVQVGDLAPDFLFEYASDRCLALRRLQGRLVLLNFWTSWSNASLEELRYLQRLYEESKQQLVILAINDGEDPELVSKVFQENGFTFSLVTDPNRQISQSYGIACWPTTVSVDEVGRVNSIQFGLTPRAHCPL